MTFTPTARRILINNGLIILFFVMVFISAMVKVNNVPSLLMLFILSILFVIIPIIIHFNYWTLDKRLVLSVNDRVIIKNKRTGKAVIINVEDIEAIETVESSSGRAIWNLNEYFRIKLKNGDFVTLTNYVIDGAELIQLLNLEKKRIRKTEFIPIVGDNELSDIDKTLRTTKAIRHGGTVDI